MVSALPQRQRLPPSDSSVNTNLTVLLLIIGGAAFLTGITKGSIAAALGALITPILAIVLPAPLAIGITLIMFLVGDACAVLIRWKTWDRRIVLSVLPGTAAGIVVGSLVLGRLSAQTVSHALGVVAIVYALYRLSGWRAVAKRDDDAPIPFWEASAFGALTGFASTLANAGGPIFTIFLLLCRLPLTIFLGTAALYYALLNTMKLPGYLAIGVLQPDALLLMVWTLPLIPFGVWTGRILDRYIDLATFERLIVVLLIVTGIILLLK